MQVDKWSDGLAVRLPTALITALELKEGDKIETKNVGDRIFLVFRDRTREDALAQLCALSRPLPPGFRFSRDEANERTE